MGKYVLCSEKINDQTQSKLKALGYLPVLLPAYERLPEQVSSHPDMLIYRLSSGVLLTYAGYYAQNRSLFRKLGCGVIADDILPAKKYPRDIHLNALRLDDIVFGRTDMLSEFILSDARKSEFIRQGYARCSACVIDDKTLITADSSVASAVLKFGAEVTLIGVGNIRLSGYGCGFIGGASGQIDHGIAFFGDILTHPEGEKIKAAVYSRGKDIISLDAGVLTDHGGLIVV